ncbi:hypothetical protein [Parapedobacter tibetensis]|uniref:hypothetical protein n=1 Tax=Parapedobacter tibetensis TaxID=2972951 RepID=UPI00214DE456|nr:hypothetical protein [Parapedobacter tibetensis]
MKTRVYSILALPLLLLTVNFTSAKAQTGTYCDDYYRFCVATSHQGWDMQDANAGFYGTVSSGIYYSASITAYTGYHSGYIWILYYGGSYILQSNNEGSKAQNGTFSTSGQQLIEVYVQASNAQSFASVGW